MKGEKDARSPHKAVFGFRPRGGLSSVRYENWKLVLPSTNPKGDKSPVELYDLNTDLAESINVADKHPQIVRKMTDMGQKANMAIIENKAIN